MDKIDEIRSDAPYENIVDELRPDLLEADAYYENICDELRSDYLEADAIYENICDELRSELPKANDTLNENIVDDLKSESPRSKDAHNENIVDEFRSVLTEAGDVLNANDIKSNLQEGDKLAYQVSQSSSNEKGEEKKTFDNTCSNDGDGVKDQNELKCVETREERIRRIKEQSEMERQKKLSEIYESQKRAQELREKEQEERRKRIDELKRREEERRKNVEQKRKEMEALEKEKAELRLRKNKEREARAELQKKQQSSPRVMSTSMSQSMLISRNGSSNQRMNSSMHNDGQQKCMTSTSSLSHLSRSSWLFAANQYNNNSNNNNNSLSASAKLFVKAKSSNRARSCDASDHGNRKQPPPDGFIEIDGRLIPANTRHIGCFLPYKGPSYRVKGVLAWQPPKESSKMPTSNAGGLSWWQDMSKDCNRKAQKGYDSADNDSLKVRNKSRPLPSRSQTRSGHSAFQERAADSSSSWAGSSKGKRTTVGSHSEIAKIHTNKVPIHSSGEGSIYDRLSKPKRSGSQPPDHRKTSIGSSPVNKTLGHSKPTKEMSSHIKTKTNLTPKSTPSTLRKSYKPKAEPVVTKKSNEILIKSSQPPSTRDSGLSSSPVSDLDPIFMAEREQVLSEKSSDANNNTNSSNVAPTTNTKNRKSTKNHQNENCEAIGNGSKLVVTNDENGNSEMTEEELYRIKLAEQKRLAREKKEKQLEEQRKLEEEAREKAAQERKRMEEEAKKVREEALKKIQEEEEARQLEIIRQKEMEEEEKRKKEEEDRLKVEEDRLKEEEKQRELREAEESRMERKRRLEKIMSRVKKPQNDDQQQMDQLQADDGAVTGVTTNVTSSNDNDSKNCLETISDNYDLSEMQMVNCSDDTQTKHVEELETVHLEDAVVQVEDPDESKPKEAWKSENPLTTASHIDSPVAISETTGNISCPPESELSDNSLIIQAKDENIASASLLNKSNDQVPPEEKQLVKEMPQSTNNGAAFKSKILQNMLGSGRLNKTSFMNKRHSLILTSSGAQNNSNSNNNHQMVMNSSMIISPSQDDSMVVTHSRSFNCDLSGVGSQEPQKSSLSKEEPCDSNNNNNSNSSCVQGRTFYLGNENTDATEADVDVNCSATESSVTESDDLKDKNNNNDDDDDDINNKGNSKEIIGDINTQSLDSDIKSFETGCSE